MQIYLIRVYLYLEGYSVCARACVFVFVRARARVPVCVCVCAYTCVLSFDPFCFILSSKLTIISLEIRKLH